MDKIIRTLICGGQISLTVLETTELVNKAIEIHNLEPSAAEMLGGLLTCGAYLASGLKVERGCVSLTVKAKDGDGAVSVSADGQLHVRGYADGTCTQTLEGGSLTVVREDGYNTQPFVGTCEIAGGDVADILETYFQQSEQIPTAVAFKPEFGGGKCISFTGVVLQLLPDASDDAVDEAAERLVKFKDGGTDADAHKIFENYFRPLAGGETTEIFPQYKCNCSEKKIRGVLASVGKAELLKICDEQGAVKVHCHYCNKDYTYDKKRIEETF